MTRRATVIAITVLLLGCLGPASAAGITLKASGSVLMAPLFREWARAYAESHPDVTVTTATTDSHHGTLDVFAGAAQIGTSDAFLTDEEMEAHPGFVDVALATSAVAIAYHLPGLKGPLKLDGPTLAAIYDGGVHYWDDTAIAELNPDLTLPHHVIVPIRLARSATETSLVAQYLTASGTERENGADTPEGAWSDSPGLRTSVAWAVIDGARQAESNDAMVEALAQTPYAIGYASFPFVDDLVRAKLGLAAMRSRSDEFVLPEVRTLAAATASLTLRMPADMRLTQVDAPGTGCYPLVNYEYAVVAKDQGDATKAVALRDFLEWAISRDAASFEHLAAAHLVGLPSSTWLKSLAQIDLIR